MLSSTLTRADRRLDDAVLVSVERARPLLGTIVSLRIAGLPATDAHALADDAFAEIALIHRLMSFQEATSEVSRINREAVFGPVALHPHTSVCLAHAIDLARRSGGVFDPVRTGGSWHDIAIDDAAVRTTSPLSLDLSGIAKGYAVDRACEILRAGGAVAAMVNAGGDMRVFGSEETVVLRPHGEAPQAVAVGKKSAITSGGPGPASAAVPFDLRHQLAGRMRSHAVA